MTMKILKKRCISTILCNLTIKSLQPVECIDILETKII